MNIVKLRSRSGEGQVKVRKVRDRSFDLSYTINLVFTTTTTTTHPPPKLFSWFIRGLDMSDGLRMGCYDSSRIRGGQDFKVDFKADIKGDIREYFNESKIV